MHRITIIDTDRDSSHILDFSLTHQGFQVYTVIDPHQAYASVCRSHPDLILLESKLNEVDGLQLLRSLKANPALAGIPILIMSIQGRDVDFRAARNAGATGYILKPYTVQDVVERISNLLLTT